MEMKLINGGVWFLSQEYFDKLHEIGVDACRSSSNVKGFEQAVKKCHDAVPQKLGTILPAVEVLARVRMNSVSRHKLSGFKSRLQLELRHFNNDASMESSWQAISDELRSDISEFLTVIKPFDHNQKKAIRDEALLRESSAMTSRLAAESAFTNAVSVVDSPLQPWDFIKVPTPSGLINVYRVDEDHQELKEAIGLAFDSVSQKLLIMGPDHYSMLVNRDNVKGSKGWLMGSLVRKLRAQGKIAELKVVLNDCSLQEALYGDDILPSGLTPRMQATLALNAVELQLVPIAQNAQVCVAAKTPVPISLLATENEIFIEPHLPPQLGAKMDCFHYKRIDGHTDAYSGLMKYFELVFSSCEIKISVN